jgi:signal transduction histidine kinase
MDEPRRQTALQAMSDAVLGIAAELSVEAVLQRLVDAARGLAGARYAAIGVPDEDGGFALFLTDGIDAETWDRIGSLPRTHGILGELLCRPETIRQSNIMSDPRFGYYPRHHPLMRSFLGVPIIAGGEILAELFLAEKDGGGDFTDDDQRIVEMLASHAALAVVNGQLNERARELSIVEERTRIARDLHDSVTQTLFSLTLVTESAVTLAGNAEPKLGTQLDRVRQLSRTALEEMRSLVETLRGTDAGREGLEITLRKRVDLLRAVHDVPIGLVVHGTLPQCGQTITREVLKIANEALANALQHAGATTISIELDHTAGRLTLTVADDGAGFDLVETVQASRRLGLSSMRERAEALGGTLRIDTAPGAGTRVTLEVPSGR